MNIPTSETELVTECKPTPGIAFLNNSNDEDKTNDVNKYWNIDEISA
jgi:hypothetical protein